MCDFVYQVHSQVVGMVNGHNNLGSSFTWNPQNFAGFYYDLNQELGTETLKLSGANPYSFAYTTTAQNKHFEQALWGSYKVIGFGTEKCFAGYIQGNSEGSNIFYKESSDSNSLASGQLEKILKESTDETTLDTGMSMILEEGYELAIKSIDANGVHLELKKDDHLVDSKILSPSKAGANEMDKTYWYRNPSVGVQKNLVTIGVHFKSAQESQNEAVIDSIWQISDRPIKIEADTQYGAMTIKTVNANAGTITMDNKDNLVVLSKNKDFALMPGHQHQDRQ
jgi:S-layer protein (TIGR01567 family)